MPVDLATWTQGETQYDNQKHTSHFDTCPDRAQHRRSGRTQEQPSRLDRDFERQMAKEDRSDTNRELDLSDPRDDPEDVPF